MDYWYIVEGRFIIMPGLLWDKNGSVLLPTGDKVHYKPLAYLGLFLHASR